MRSLSSAAVVAAVALAVPVLMRLVRARLPEAVVEIALGIAIGPQVLGWVTADEAVQVLALVGVAFLLLLAGLEIDLRRLRGRVLAVTVTGYAASFALALRRGPAVGGHLPGGRGAPAASERAVERASFRALTPAGDGRVWESRPQRSPAGN